jgi:hypothetical protein
MKKVEKPIKKMSKEKSKEKKGGGSGPLINREKKAQ